MKKTSILSLLASAVVAVALLTGCNTDNDLDNGDDGLASLELASVSSSDMLTRAAIDGTTFPTDKGSIGLFLYMNETATQPYGTGYANVAYSYNESKEKWTASPSIKVGSTPGYLYGYFPYKENYTDVKAIPVSSSLDGDDVMYASRQDAITDMTAARTSLTMNHALARVAITVINKGYVGDAKLSSIKFENAKIAASGTLDATSGSITASKADEVTLPVPTAEQPIATGDGSTYECLLVPSEANSSRQTVTLSLTIDGQAKTLTLSGDNGVIFQQGVKSKVTITLSNTGIAAQTVSVEDWNVVEVGGHTVTVKMADEVTPHDVLTDVYVDENTVKIKALSLSGGRLDCAVAGTAAVSRAVSGNTCTFTVSGIGSDVTATMSYETPLTVTALSSNTALGTATFEGYPYAGETITLTATPNGGCHFVEWQDADGETIGTDNPLAVTSLASDLTVKAVFEVDGVLPGVFTVNGSGKTVRFSKGNLYYDGSKYGFEENQYDVILVDFDHESHESENHVGHFNWSQNEDYARSLSAVEPRDPSYNGEPGKDVFFTNDADDQTRPNSNFVANGAKGIWRVLSGDENGEWTYLLNRTGKNGNALCKLGVTIIDGPNDEFYHENCLILLPDDWEWGKNGVGDGWLDEYSETTTVKWTTMEAAGAVCLPAAGYRDGGVGSTDTKKIQYINDFGYYWSASRFYSSEWGFYRESFASSVKFNWVFTPNTEALIYYSRSVRLVTEEQ